MEKIIDLEDNNKIFYSRENGYCTDFIKINKVFFKDGKLDKQISFSIWDDIQFDAHTFNNDNVIKEEEKEKLEFDFDISDPLYFCLNRLLNGKDELIIDDDETYGVLKNYMIIKKVENNIKIIFNYSKERMFSCNFSKFKVFIKNIVFDSRSKITDDTLKKRICDFFKECEKNLLEEEHQVTFDEYIEQERYNKVLVRRKNGR